jgi:hypothetical protein
VLGLRWTDIDFEAKTLTIRLSRGEVTGAGIVEGEPKTERGKRTLPLDDSLVAALRALKTLQNQDRLKAGEAYSAGCRHCGGQHLVVDETGRPYRPEWYSDQFHQAARCPAHLSHDHGVAGSPHHCGFEMARPRDSRIHVGSLRPQPRRRDDGGRSHVFRRNPGSVKFL